MELSSSVVPNSIPALIENVVDHVQDSSDIAAESDSETEVEEAEKTWQVEKKLGYLERRGTFGNHANHTNK